MNEQHPPAERDDPLDTAAEQTHAPPMPPAVSNEIGGPSGLDPTRYGDWERNGRCFDF